MNYSIGDVSRVLGITTSALHFYEKEGIINTPKGETGRRYYQEADVNRLISVKKYRAMGVSVRDIAKQFSVDGMTGSEVVVRMRTQLKEAQRMAQQYAKLSADISLLLEQSERALNTSGEVDIVRSQDMIFFSSARGLIPQGIDEQLLAKNWLEAMPAVRISICKQAPDRPASHVLTIPAARAADFGITVNDKTTRLIPGGMALHAVVICGEEQYQQPDVIFKSLLSFAQEHRFTQKGMMWGTLLFVDCSMGKRRHYYDTYMTFE